MPYERTIEIAVTDTVVVRFRSYKLSDSCRHCASEGQLGRNRSLMEHLAHSNNSPGTDASFELLSRIAVDSDSDERYPNGTVLVPADSADASNLISRAINERKPIALVFPDGSDVVARPPEATGLMLIIVLGLLWLADRASRSRDRPTFVPREWVTEFHASPAREPQLVS